VKKVLSIVAVAMLVAACSSTAATPAPVQSTAPGTVAPTGPTVGVCANNTLTVWTMSGSWTDAVANQFITTFENAHPGCVVKWEVQNWDGIVNKINTALSSNNPPDVFEVGNTDALSFEANGMFADLSSYRVQLGGGTSIKHGDANQLWVDSLNDASVYDGKTVAVPFYAGDRELVYRADLFKAAGIDPATITSKAKLLAAAQTLIAKNPASNTDFSGVYVPGQNWYSLIQMIWDEGGQIATQDASGKWSGQLESAASEKGIQDYVDYYTQGGSTAPKDKDEANPPEWTLFQQGKIGMMIGSGWEPSLCVGKTGAVTDASQVGVTEIPSATDGKTMPVFLGGSVIAIAGHSQSIQAAVDFVSELTSPAGQNAMIGEGWIPSTKLFASNIPDTGSNHPLIVQATEAAAGSGFTPNAKGWAAVEANNPLKSMMTAILNNPANLDSEAKKADAAMNAVING